MIDRKRLSMVVLTVMVGSLLVFVPIGLTKGSGHNEPEYQVVKQDGNVELREYKPYIMAQVQVASDFNGAMYSGFMKLFNYISGKNTNQSRIKMTIPVTEEQVSASEKIPMTAPVTSERSGNSYVVSFVMPVGYTLGTMPVPDDKNITFKEMPAHQAAVIKFSGRMSQELADKKIGELKAWLEKHDLSAKSNFPMAQYNPPWIPGFMRRNEIIVEV